MTATYPALVDRIKSMFVDLLVVLLLTFLSGYILDKFEEVPDWVRIVLFVGIWVVYEPMCTSLGSTLGNYILGIRVRQQKNYRLRINFFSALARFVTKMLLGWISFITVHMNKEKRAIHDIAAGSVMIKKEPVMLAVVHTNGQGH